MPFRQKQRKAGDGEEAGPARPDPEDGGHDDEDHRVVAKDEQIAPKQEPIHVDRQRQAHLLDDALGTDERGLQPSVITPEMSVHTTNPRARNGA